MSSIGVPLRVGRARGLRFGEIPSEIERALPRWLATRHVEEGLSIKATRVYRAGPWLVKFTGGSRALKDVLRSSSAIRSARMHSRLLPLRTPAPLLALEQRTGPFLERSLLVTEFVEGVSLAEAWGKDERAMASLPAFMAGMHRRGVFHGDLHPRNVIWNGAEWFLIDLAALRHPLRALWRSRLIVEQWAQLALRLESEPRVRTCFEAYLARMDLGWEREQAWERVLERARRLRAARGP